MIRLNLVDGLGPMLQIAEGWTVELPDDGDRQALEAHGLHLALHLVRTPL